MRKGDTVLALGMIVLIFFGAGQFLIGAHIIEQYLSPRNHNLVLGLWTVGVIAEVWLLFVKAVIPLAERAEH